MTKAMTPTQDEQALRLLHAAEELFYARGVQSVSMDEVRAASGIALKRMYQLFRTKTDLVIAVLDHRDRRWRGELEDFVAGRPEAERVEAIFDWLHQWFSTPGFRGCAWINAFGELGGTDIAVVRSVQRHKQAFHDIVARAVAVHGCASIAPAICLLAEGAIVNASIGDDASQARIAKQAALRLLQVAE